ncbi:MAG: L-ribulose-5-phosphate 4-epimerase [Verrucomicrobiota bacterium]
MNEELRNAVCEANLELRHAGLVTLTWGNVSGVDRERNIMLIKPSGVSYADMTPEDMVPVSLEDGTVPAECALNPSSDTPTHLLLYRAFPELGGIVHTHSTTATSWAQAGQSIPCFGTTHADHFYGPVPATRPLSDEEITDEYVANTGRVIIEHFQSRGLHPLHVPGVLVANHGPFTWGNSPADAVHNAVALEEIARMALETLALNPEQPAIPHALLNRHFQRKHGPNATYGQR